MLCESHPFNISVTYGLTFFFLKINFRGNIFYSCYLELPTTVPFYLLGGRPSITGKCLLISSSRIWSGLSAACETTVVWCYFFFLQLLLKKQILLNCILYTSQSSGFIIHQTLCNLFWNIFHSFSWAFQSWEGKQHEVLEFSIPSSDV